MGGCGISIGIRRIQSGGASGGRDGREWHSDKPLIEGSAIEGAVYLPRSGSPRGALGFSLRKERGGLRRGATPEETQQARAVISRRSSTGARCALDRGLKPTATLGLPLRGKKKQRAFREGEGVHFRPYLSATRDGRIIDFRRNDTSYCQDESCTLTPCAAACIFWV